MKTKVIVMGAGPGGYVAAVRAAQLGADVCVIEKESLGGTCLNRGCIPSKIMRTTADWLTHMRNAQSYGIDIQGAVKPNIEKLMARKDAIVQTQVKGIASLLRHHGIDHVKGTAMITAPGRLAVRREDGESRMMTWDRLIIATGTAPLNIPAFAFDGHTILSSDDILKLSVLPASIVIVGGGVIGCEFACIMAAMGTRVTLVEAMPRLLPLPSVDDACSKALLREMKKQKIKVLLNQTVEKVTPMENGAEVITGPSPFAADRDAAGFKPETLPAEKVLVCIGRRPNSEDIGLDAIDVLCCERGWILADDRLQTNVAGVYAIGDILGPEKIMLAHVASAEAVVAAENALGLHRSMRYDAVPSAIFTMPEVASVGLTESQARARAANFRSDSVLFRVLGKTQVLGELAGEAKVISEQITGKVLGVHLIGPHATDLIAEGTLAVATGRTVQDIAGTIHAHPTLAEVMLEVSLKAMDRSLHG